MLGDTSHCALDANPHGTISIWKVWVAAFLIHSRALPVSRSLGLGQEPGQLLGLGWGRRPGLGLGLGMKTRTRIGMGTGMGTKTRTGTGTGTGMGTGMGMKTRMGTGEDIWPVLTFQWNSYNQREGWTLTSVLPAVCIMINMSCWIVITGNWSVCNNPNKNSRIPAPSGE